MRLNLTALWDHQELLDSVFAINKTRLNRSVTKQYNLLFTNHMTHTNCIPITQFGLNICTQLTSTVYIKQKFHNSYIMLMFNCM
jgi:hypothetical protein